MLVLKKESQYQEKLSSIVIEHLVRECFVEWAWIGMPREDDDFFFWLLIGLLLYLVQCLNIRIQKKRKMKASHFFFEKGGCFIFFFLKKINKKNLRNSYFFANSMNFAKKK